MHHRHQPFSHQPSAMTRLSILVIVLLSTAVGYTQPAAPARPDISAFFKPGVVFQDRNGDGVVDFVDARVALAESPTAGELAAAADVAARLGFETSAMDLPVVRLKPDPTKEMNVGSGFSRTYGATIFIGAKSL